MIQKQQAKLKYLAPRCQFRRSNAENLSAQLSGHDEHVESAPSRDTRSSAFRSTDSNGPATMVPLAMSKHSQLGVHGSAEAGRRPSDFSHSTANRSLRHTSEAKLTAAEPTP